MALAIEQLFGIKLSKREGLRNKVGSFMRNGLIVYNDQLIVERNSRAIPRDQLTTLHNAVIIQALLPDPKKVKKVFEDQAFRQNMAKLFSALLLGRRSIVDISLLKPEVARFLGVLSGTTNLREERLANPFETLPQLVLDGPLDLLQAILAQNSSLSSGDAMMVHYLEGNLEAAWDSAQQMSTTDPRLLQYRDLIEREYRAAKEFDDLLDFLQ
ncbi:hypothetical protein [Microbulbifer sp. YPW1]|uniref:hypothetical protein n=1 Tax=Microbulbifer sp. YPW1 TaxID=2745199 RepID=UPI001597CE18|nr:hypothetical protein [Microbulbifer sp. YPW1]QKX17313.1 hypothetical protein HUW35_10050 [Microbulbifer sp. YPW1]